MEDIQTIVWILRLERDCVVKADERVHHMHRMHTHSAEYSGERIADIYPFREVRKKLNELYIYDAQRKGFEIFLSLLNKKDDFVLRTLRALHLSSMCDDIPGLAGYIRDTCADVHLPEEINLDEGILRILPTEIQEIF